MIPLDPAAALTPKTLRTIAMRLEYLAAFVGHPPEDDDHEAFLLHLADEYDPPPLRHEPDEDSWQHETSFVCRHCRRRVDLDDFEPGGKHIFQPKACPARTLADEYDKEKPLTDAAAVLARVKAWLPCAEDATGLTPIPDGVEWPTLREIAATLSQQTARVERLEKAICVELCECGNFDYPAEDEHDEQCPYRKFIAALAPQGRGEVT